MNRENRNVVSVEQLREIFKVQKFEMKDDLVDQYQFFVPERLKFEVDVDEQKQ